MNLRTETFAVLALWAVFAVGCQDVESDCPASRPETTEATEPITPSPDSTEPDAEPGTETDTEPDTKPPDTPETATDEQTGPSEDVVEDLGTVLKEIAVLEQDARFFEAFTRVRGLLKTYRGLPEESELNSLHHRLYQYHRKSSGLDFAIGQLGSDSTTAVSVATGKLIETGEAGLTFLRKAVRQAEPKIAASAAEILIQQREPQITRLMVERMEQDPPEPLGDDLGKLLQHLDTIEPEWIDRLCALARREGSGQAGAVGVLIDRLERSIRVQLEAGKPKEGKPEDGDEKAGKKDKPEQPEPAPIEVDQRLVRTLGEVAMTAEGPIQRQVVEALLMLVLEHVSRRDADAFNQLLGNDQAYGFVGDYVVANLESEELEDRLWAIPRAALLQMRASGFWARVQLDDDPMVLDERLDPALSFADLTALCVTGPVEKGQTIHWTGFVNVPADGDYTFSVDCAQSSPTTLFVDSEQTTADKAVELSAGWHEVRAEMSLSGDEALIQVAWAGPDLSKQSIPVERVACVDRTRTLIWRLGRKCDLPEARSLAEQLLLSLERVDKELAEKLMVLAQIDKPARPAIAAALGEWLDHSIAHESEPPKWETQALPLLLSASEEISGPEQRRVVASLVNHLVRRTGSKIEEFNRQAESPEAYGRVRAFIAERLDDQEPEVARWAMQRAGAVQLALTGLWAKTYVQQDPAEENDLLDERLSGSLNFADSAALQLGLAKRIIWKGYLNVPVQGAYTFAVDSDQQIAIRLDGEAVEPGKAIELAAGLHPVTVEFRLTSGQRKLVLSWQPPDKTEPEVIPADGLICPDWPKVLIWEMAQKPQQAEAIAVRLGLMVNRIDQPLAEELLALVEPESPSALPAAEVLASVLSAGRLDDTFEKTFVVPLWPLVEKTDGSRQRMLAGALVRALGRLFANNGPEFDKAVKAEGASQTFREFVTERLDVEELAVRLWAAEHAGPFTLLRSGLEASYFGADFETRLFDCVHTKMQFEPGQFGYPDKRNDNMGIRWSGLIGVPADGKYIFSCVVDDTCRLWLDGRPVIHDANKPATANLTAGLHEIRVEFVETTGPERLVVYWQPPGQSQPQVLAGELKHVDLVQLLLYKLTRRPDDQQAVSWLQELGYKADRLAPEPIGKLAELAQKRASWQSPLASTLAAAILRNPGGAPAPAAPLLSKSAPALQGAVRRRAVEALVAYLSAGCGGDKAKFQQAVGSDKTYDFLCEEVRSAAESTKAAETEWAQQQGEILGLKLGSPDE